MQKALKVLKIVILSLLGIAMLVSGVLLLSAKLFFDDMNEKTYYEYVFDIPDSENKLIAKEYFSFRESGVEFWLRTEKKGKTSDKCNNKRIFSFRQ